MTALYQDALNGARRGLIPEDLLHFRWLEELALDPSGRFLAYTVKKPDVASNAYTSDLYIQTRDPKSVLRLTNGRGIATSLAWSHSGNKLAFAWNEAGKSSVQVQTIAEHNNTLATENVRLYELSGATLTALDWCADGERLAGLRWTPMRHPRYRNPSTGIPAPTIKVIRRLRYKMDGAGWVHDRYLQIWTLELATGDLHQITHSEIDYFEPKWSNHGARLAFIGLAREQNTELGQGQIFIHDHQTSSAPTRLLPNWTGACRSPAWGNDDRHIAFAGHNQPAPVNRRIFMQPFIADLEKRTAHALAPDLDQEVGNYAVADQRAGLSNITVRWAANSPWIYFLLTEQGSVSLYRIQADGHYERIVTGPHVAFEYSPAVGDQVAYGLANSASPGDLYLWGNGKTTRCTDLNPWLCDHALPQPQEYWYPGIDGAQVHAWLLKPPNFNAAKRYPTIVYVHCSMFSWDFNHEFQCLAAAGFVVAYFNQRGTTAGYGQAWTRASEGDQGGRDYEEIMLGVDELVQRPYIDATRLGVTGGSCGGFMTNWIIGHSNRFRAAVTQRSITNQISFFGTSDIGPECTLGETSDTPWTNLDALWRQSPIAYAADIHTPLLILHSDQDHRCALEQAEQLFAVLRWLDRPVELVIFEGENHSLSRGGRLGNRIERLHRITGWFVEHL